ncbi:Os03g0762200 [Oryza sativa Japonica Group]|uniref:Os03g0762200 protein n=2 Tax=Oryza sativa subsp. japonica TaxID=39947 RepID=Q0DNB5_ORYSJ|nr:hypothetical protein EE612_020610 [Oryza sativa]BAF13273.1 Os03g0762200 [Oryza sativa Japonica Group]BAS86520.1 Os03g0762200 [Oryza sativa Japonica Group]|eukprot:NP_001051359.1 Os03g0762200 [Oryza sativa Japonica Group]
MASRVAMASTSVQETWSGHAASTAALALLTVSNPSNASERLSGASLSAVLPAVDVISTEPSHPCTPRHATPHTRRQSIEIAMLDTSPINQSSKVFVHRRSSRGRRGGRWSRWCGWWPASCPSPRRARCSRRWGTCCCSSPSSGRTRRAAPRRRRRAAPSTTTTTAEPSC